MRGTCRLRSWGTLKPPVNGLYEEEVRQFKKRLIVRTLRECGWRKAESARVLGVARGYLHRLINQLEIREPEDAVEAEARDRLSGGEAIEHSLARGSSLVRGFFKPKLRAASSHVVYRIGPTAALSAPELQFFAHFYAF